MTQTLWHSTSQPDSLVSKLGPGEWSSLAAANWAESGLSDLGVPAVAWACEASNRAQQYSTHGLFRYFGKFPPYVAQELISDYTAPGDCILDPMCGSGTTAVEALLAGRACDAIDINPLAALLATVKTTPIDGALAKEHVGQVLSSAARAFAVGATPDSWPRSVDIERFFLPETTAWLVALRGEIESLPVGPERNALLVALLSIIRKVSRATSQQGRLFMDVDSAEPDPRPRFEKVTGSTLSALAALQPSSQPISVRCESALEFDVNRDYPLIIFHPPYFNNYKYSRVNSLELAWLREDPRAIARHEVREFFKVGKPENHERYLEDIEAMMRRLARLMTPSSTLAVMIGDTRLRGQRVQVVRKLVEATRDILDVELAIVRQPQFTEASWAASQRRKRGDLGVQLTDFIVILRKASA